MGEAPAVPERRAGAAPQDPLVDAYVARYGAQCAARVWQPAWLLWGALAAWAAALLVVTCCGAPSPLAEPAPAAVVWLHQHLGDPAVALAGMAAGSLVVGALAALQRQPALQETLYGGLLAAILYLLLYDPLIGLGAVLGTLGLLYAAGLALRLLAIACGSERAAAPSADPPSWPSYTVLVPLYREPKVIGSLLAALHALEYPRDRLQVLLLLEADDSETLSALAAEQLPPWIEPCIVPPGQPRTKPRACNHGLARATGELLVIFDAEDRPEPDQLQRAARAFSTAPPQIACLQARLLPYNPEQNLLTAWFAIEYAVWFLRYLPGLVRLGLPIPLGGTSNHFRCDVLRELGGWDPFNVTEDCDLGVRLHAAGYRTRMLDAITWEEAPADLRTWIGQRSRWLKGYLVTHLVWWRRPLFLLRRLGPWGVLGCFLTVPCATLLSALALPLSVSTLVYLGLLLLDVQRGFQLWDLLSARLPMPSDPLSAATPWSWPLVYVGPDEDPWWSMASLCFAGAAVVLLCGNGIVLAIAARWGGAPRRWRGFWRAVMLLPVAWFLISLAAWRALWELCLRPHYWRKTAHGGAAPSLPQSSASMQPASGRAPRSTTLPPGSHSC
ncbi:MAG: glycosyltransferase [Planctomycetota bacterium]|nr:glycosyltransferase [Planctomycetota bacterium]MDW8373546.1 glycosyltransferase [Planctomycetota bacterium]